jgi:hypothetical protein
MNKKKFVIKKEILHNRIAKLQVKLIKCLVNKTLKGEVNGHKCSYFENEGKKCTIFTLEGNC